jgi:hypothetical protein
MPVDGFPVDWFFQPRSERERLRALTASQPTYTTAKTQEPNTKEQ